MTNDERSHFVNDECRMTNVERRSKSELPEAPGHEQRDWGVEAVWGGGGGTGAGELREEASHQKRVFDLEERTARFGEAIIRFAKKIPQNPVNNRLIEQLVGAGTSVGANYCEADDAVSKKDFRNKIGTCRKEAKETKFFLRMVATAEESLCAEARNLWQEAKELHLIFCSFFGNSFHDPKTKT